MAVVKIAVFSSRPEAESRAVILGERGWTVDGPKKIERVQWENKCFGGSDDTAEDADGEVWMLSATK